jgi:16S rRNA (guanine1207-N2)-methyltransferase
MNSSAETAQTKALGKFLASSFCWPGSPGRVLSIRASSPEPLRVFDPGDVVCLQTDRAQADRLEAAGYSVSTEVAGEFGLCLVEATKHKEENLFHVALAWSLLRPDGQLVFCGANALGGDSLAKRITAAGFPVRAIVSKAKCRIIRLQRDSGAPEPVVLADWRSLGDFRENPAGLLTCPGIFSPQAVDQGTRLLCEALRLPLRGSCADFGAGYGALSRHILQGSPGLQRLDLYEAEWKALEAARRNLAAWGAETEIGYHWQDITRLSTARRYDWIAMNPPFHAGREAVPALGKAFIACAASALAPGGTLFLVANRHLPYESVLGERFGDVVMIGEREGFKVVEARKPPAARR